MNEKFREFFVCWPAVILIADGIEDEVIFLAIRCWNQSVLFESMLPLRSSLDVFFEFANVEHVVDVFSHHVKWKPESDVEW